MRQMLSIPEIRVGSFQWTCKVMVIEKQNPRLSKTTPGKHFRPMLLQDTKGFKVQAMTYGDEIDLFGQRMDLHGTYLVSGAVVKAARDASRVPDLRYPNIWTLTRSTLVQPVLPPDAIDVAVLGPVSLTPFSKFYDHLNDNMFIDAMAIVIQKLPRQWIMVDKRQVVAAEYIIVDEECLPIVLTLWESFVAIQGVEIDYELRQGNFPVVHLKSLQCTLFQGLKLGTRYASSFGMASTHERAVELNQWKAANIPLIRNMIAIKAHLHSLIKLANPMNKLFYTTTDLSILHDALVITWMKANIVIPPGTNFSFYVGCGFCSGKINTDEGVKHDCMHYGGKNSISILRYKLEVNVTDATGQANTIMFSDQVDRLLSLAGMRFENGAVDIDVLAEKIGRMDFIVGLKRNANDELGRAQDEHVLACLDDATKFQLSIEHTPEKESHIPGVKASGISDTPTTSLVTLSAESMPTQCQLNSQVSITQQPNEDLPCKPTKRNETESKAIDVSHEEKTPQISTPTNTTLVTIEPEQTSAKRKLNFNVSTPIKTAEQPAPKKIKQEPQAGNADVTRQEKQKKLG